MSGSETHAARTPQATLPATTPDTAPMLGDDVEAIRMDQNGGSIRELQTHSCTCPACISLSETVIERINSEFAFIKDRRRNKLAHVKANKRVRMPSSTIYACYHVSNVRI